MKRLLLALAVPLALVSVLASTAYAARVLPGHVNFDPLKWRSYKASGNVDSLTATITPSTTDTSEVFSLDKMVGPAGLHTTATSGLPVFRLWFYTSVASDQMAATVDSVATITIQVSNDNSTWFTAATGGVVLAAANDRVTSFNVNGTLGNASVNSGGSPANWTLCRVIAAGTGNTIPAVNLMVAYFDAKEPSLYGGEDVSAGRWRVDQLKFSTDSLTAKFVDAGSGAFASVVTQAVSTQDKTQWRNVLSSTSGGSMRVTLERASFTTINVDSSYASIEVSCDKTNWTTWTSFTGSATGFSGAATNGYAYDIPLNDAVTAGGASSSANSCSMAPFIRVRIRAPRGEAVASTWKVYLGYMPAY